MKSYVRMQAAMISHRRNEARKPYAHRVADAYEGECAKMGARTTPAKKAQRVKLLKYWARARGH